jgi:hypothetical protein
MPYRLLTATKTKCMTSAFSQCPSHSSCIINSYKNAVNIKSDLEGLVRKIWKYTMNIEENYIQVKFFPGN